MRRKSWIERRAERAVARAVIERWIKRLRIAEAFCWMAGCEIWLIEQLKGAWTWFVGCF